MDIFSEILFWPTDPKKFLKAPSAPINTNFEGEHARKKNAAFCQKFFVEIFQKVPKNAAFDFFQKFAKLMQNKALGEINQFGRPKKKVVKVFETFLKIRPLEKILDPPMIHAAFHV